MAEAYITRLSAVLPGEPVGNEEMEDVLGRINGRPSRARAVVLRSNGITRRHYVVDPETGEPRWNNAQLTADAVRGLFDETLSMDDVEVLSCGTSIADQLMPNHGVMVHGELGSPPCEVVATAGICTSGVTALKYGYLSVKSGDAANAVATGSEVSSTIMHARHFEGESDARVTDLGKRPEVAFEKEFLRWMLSDGAGALLIRNRPEPEGLSLRIDWMDVKSYAGEMPTCMYAGAEKNEAGDLVGWREVREPGELIEKSYFTVKQDVKLLNDNIVEITVERALAGVMERRGLAPGDVDWFLPHMSSEYFRDRLQASMEKIGCHIPQDRWFTNLTTRGNTGSASIYIMLEELMRSGRVRRGERILCFVPESGRFTAVYMLLTVQ